MVANVYEVYNLINSHLSKKISNKCLKQTTISFMQVLIPFAPHLASECLENLDNSKINKWPVFNETLVQKQRIKIAIQINGKTREIIATEKDLSEKEVVQISKKNDKINNYILNKTITRTVFVKNKIINFLIK